MLDVKGDMIENIDDLITRSCKIEVIADIAMRLSVVSTQYVNSSKKLKDKERRIRYCKIGVVVMVIALIVVIIIMATSGRSNKKATQSKPKPDEKPDDKKDITPA